MTTIGPMASFEEVYCPHSIPWDEECQQCADHVRYEINERNELTGLTRGNADERTGGGKRKKSAPASNSSSAPTAEQDVSPGQGLNSSDSFISSTGAPWPTLDPAALHGPAGDAVNLLAPQSEADPAGILVTLLITSGAMIGPTPHARAGHTTHPARLGALLVGDTAKARKGTSWSTSRTVLQHVDPKFLATRVLGGFGSGEAVVDEVADAGPDDEEGPRDKRLLIYEPEFARVLKVCTRESSVLSAVIRDAWDGGPLQTRARARKAVATGHHIAIVGHITADELRRNLTETEIAGGFANRLLWICVRRSQRLPFGGNLDDRALKVMGRDFEARIGAARKLGTVPFAPTARDCWADLYNTMADDDPGGMLGAIVARPEPQTLRLALLYALLDGARHIDVHHIRAAWAVWSYSRESARFIWGDAIGDEIADQLLKAIRKAGPEGLDSTGQSGVFSRNVNAARLNLARSELEARGLITTTTIPPEGGKGRARLVSRAVPKGHP